MIQKQTLQVFLKQPLSSRSYVARSASSTLSFSSQHIINKSNSIEDDNHLRFNNPTESRISAKKEQIKYRPSFLKKQNITDAHHTTPFDSETFEQITETILGDDKWNNTLNLKYNRNDGLDSSQNKIPLMTMKYWLDKRTQVGVKIARNIFQRVLAQISQTPESVNQPFYCNIDILHDIIKYGAKYGCDNFMDNVLHILENMEDLGTKQKLDKSMLPNKMTYNLVIDLLSKRKDKNPTTEITRLLSRMNPDTYSINSLLYGWSQRRSLDSANLCEEFLRQMQKDGQNGRLGSIKPDTVTYNTVINAWSKSNNPHSAIHSQNLLCEMQDLYDKGDDEVKPNNVTFTSVINAWGNSDAIDAAYKAEEVFKTMNLLYASGDESLKPNLITYNSLLNVFSKSVLPKSAEKSEEILRTMIRLYESGDEDARPDKISFTTCINAWSKSEMKGSASQALTILELMEKFVSDKKMNISPDIVTYNLTLKCLVNDDDEDKSLKAENIMKKMKKYRISPDLMLYNSIIQCCCTTKSDDKSIRLHALRIANQTLLELQKSKNVEPNPFTFNFYIKACDRLAKEPEKSKLIVAAWNYCCSIGQLSNPVLSIVKNTLSIPQLENLFGIKKDIRKIRVSDFPLEWSENAYSQRNYSRSTEQNKLKKTKRNGRRLHRSRKR